MAQMGSWPPGFGFNPNDDEIMRYLEQKSRNHEFIVNGYIPDVSINDYEPEDIFGFLSNGSDDEKCYFFSPRKYKYSRNSRSTLVDRTTQYGFWKATGQKRSATSRGIKQVFVFHTGRPNNETRTRWVIHEYELNGMKEFVLCTLHQKLDGNSYQRGESSSITPFVPEDPAREEATVGQVANEASFYCPDSRQASLMNFQSAGEFANVGEEVGTEHFWNNNSYDQSNYTFDETSSVTKYFDGGYY